MSKVWKVGATSPKFGRTEHIVVNEQYPGGRYTTDKQQAEIWAQECATMCNEHADSGCNEWVATVWEDDMPDFSSKD